MGKVIVVTSGKGGVGKTTSTAALGAALARAGQNVVVVDFDVGLRNLDLVLRHATGLPVSVAEDPLSCVALGTGRALEEMRTLKSLLVSGY